MEASVVLDSVHQDRTVQTRLRTLSPFGVLGSQQTHLRQTSEIHSIHVQTDWRQTTDRARARAYARARSVSPFGTAKAGLTVVFHPRRRTPRLRGLGTGGPLRHSE